MIPETFPRGIHKMVASAVAMKATLKPREWWGICCSYASVGLMGCFIFLHIFPHVTAIQEICFYVGLAMAIFSVILEKRTISFNTPLTWALLFFSLWAVMDILWALNVRNSIHDVYAYWIKNLALYFILIQFFSTRRMFLWIIRCLVISATLYSLLCLVVYYILQNHPYDMKMDAFATENPINTISMLIVGCFIFATYALKNSQGLIIRLVGLLGISINGVAVLAMQSRGALIGFAASIAFLTFRKKRNFLISFLCFSAVVSAYCAISPGFRDRIQLQNMIQNERTGIYLTAIEMIKDHPLTGIGYGLEAFNAIWDDYNRKIPSIYKREPMGHPHNIFLEVTIQLGVIGLLLFLYISVVFFQTGFRVMRRTNHTFIRAWSYCIMAVFTGILVSGLFEKTLWGSNMTFVSILFALLIILEKMSTNNALCRSDFASSTSESRRVPEAPVLKARPEGRQGLCVPSRED